MNKISEQEILILQDNFPFILREELEYAVEVGRIPAVQTLSIFDHWLSEEEADEEIMAYVSINEENKQIYLERENRLLAFFEQLLSPTGSYLFIEDENEDTGEYYSFSSDEELKLIMTNGIREKLRFNVLLPEFGLTVCTGYDMTFDLYFNDKEYLKKINELACECDLFLL